MTVGDMQETGCRIFSLPCSHRLQAPQSTCPAPKSPNNGNIQSALRQRLGNPCVRQGPPGRLSFSLLVIIAPRYPPPFSSKMRVHVCMCVCGVHASLFSPPRRQLGCSALSISSIFPTRPSTPLSSSALEHASCQDHPTHFTSQKCYHF